MRELAILVQNTVKITRNAPIYASQLPKLDYFPVYLCIFPYILAIKSQLSSNKPQSFARIQGNLRSNLIEMLK